MRKLTLATFTLFLFAFQAISQNFEPAPDAVQTKLENALKRFGTIEKVYLSDKKAKTFEAKPGKEYFAWVVYKKSSDAVRRMMIIQLGRQGEKVKIHYPKFSQAITDAENQAFLITFTVPTDTGYPSVMYKVDAGVESTVYLYEGTRGVKRD